MFPSAALTLFFYSVKKKKNQYNNGTAVKFQLALGFK